MVAVCYLIVYSVPLSIVLLLTGASCDTQKMQFIGTR